MKRGEGKEKAEENNLVGKIVLWQRRESLDGWISVAAVSLRSKHAGRVVITIRSLFVLWSVLTTLMKSFCELGLVGKYGPLE